MRQDKIYMLESNDGEVPTYWAIVNPEETPEWQAMTSIHFDPCFNNQSPLPGTSTATRKIVTDANLSWLSPLTTGNPGHKNNLTLSVGEKESNGVSSSPALPPPNKRD